MALSGKAGRFRGGFLGLTEGIFGAFADITVLVGVPSNAVISACGLVNVELNRLPAVEKPTEQSARIIRAFLLTHPLVINKPYLRY